MDGDIRKKYCRPMPEDGDNTGLSLDLSYSEKIVDREGHSVSVLEPVCLDNFSDKNQVEAGAVERDAWESKENGENFGFEELKHTISTILEDNTCIKDASYENLEEGVSRCGESPFLLNMYSLLLNMNDKLNKIDYTFCTRDTWREIFARIFANLRRGDISAAYDQLKSLYYALFNGTDVRIRGLDEVLCGFRALQEEKLPRIMRHLREAEDLLAASASHAEHAAVRDAARKRELDDLARRNQELCAELENERTAVAGELESKSRQLDLLFGLVADLNHLMCGHPVNFMDEGEIRRFFLKMKDELGLLKDENAALRAQSRSAKQNTSEIEAFLRKEIEKHVEESKRLKEDNARISRQVKRVLEKHNKYKNEMLLLNKDVIKIKEHSKRKSEVIEKQKRIIQLLQGSNGGHHQKLPVEELEERVRGLRTRVEGECDVEKKRRLVGELLEYEKILCDFQALRVRE